MNEPRTSPAPVAAPEAGIAVLPARVVAAQLAWDEAWQRVHDKAGMPGVDGVSVGRFARTAPVLLRTIEQRLASGEYRPLPLRMAELEKKGGGRRLLLVPAIRDRIPQTAVAAWLGAKWNAQFDRASFAYRPGLGVHAALRYLRELHEGGYRWVFDADIRSCFDSIDHQRLFACLDRWLGSASPIASWIRQWVEARVWDGADVMRLTRGIPQGSPLSPLLANVFLHDFDCRLREANVKFIRYADDFLVLTRTPFEIGQARQSAVGALAALGLELNDEKTRVTSFAQYFRFLGADIQGDRILLPFDKKKTALKAVFVAPRMPPALLRAWQLGGISDTRLFERKVNTASPAAPAAGPSGSPSGRRSRRDVLDRLARREPPTVARSALNVRNRRAFSSR